MELSKPEDGYTYLLDWKKYVRPETIVIIDSDQSAYQAAAANERRTIKVTNKETQEILEYSGNLSFKILANFSTFNKNPLLFIFKSLNFKLIYYIIKNIKN